MLEIIEENKLCKLYAKTKEKIILLAVVSNIESIELIEMKQNITEKTFQKIVNYSLENNLNYKIYHVLGLISKNYFNNQELGLKLSTFSKEKHQLEKNNKKNRILKFIKTEILIKRYLIKENEQMNITMHQLENISYLISNLIISYNNEKQLKIYTREIINCIYQYAFANRITNIKIEDIIRALNSNPLVDQELLNIFINEIIISHSKRR